MTGTADTTTAANSRIAELTGSATVATRTTVVRIDGQCGTGRSEAVGFAGFTGRSAKIASILLFANQARLTITVEVTITLTNVTGTLAGAQAPVVHPRMKGATFTGKEAHVVGKVLTIAGDNMVGVGPVLCHGAGKHKILL